MEDKKNVKLKTHIFYLTKTVQNSIFNKQINSTENNKKARGTGSNMPVEIVPSLLDRVNTCVRKRENTTEASFIKNFCYIQYDGSPSF